MIKKVFTIKELVSQRKAHLTEIKKAANLYLKENLALKGTHEANWQYQVIETNIRHLRGAITQANKSLEKKGLEQYAEGQVQEHLHLLSKKSIVALPEILNTVRKVTRQTELFNILRYSPSYSINYDLYWIDDGTVGDQWDVALGKKKPNIYAKYCPQKIEKIKHEVIPYLRRKKLYTTSSRFLEEIITEFEDRSHLASNILLLTVVESLVRQLSCFVYKKQNPNLSQEQALEYISKHMSLETLIKKGTWKDDLPITIREAYALTKYIDDPSLNQVIQMASANKSLSDKINDELKALQPDVELLVTQPENDNVRRKLQQEMNRIRELSTGLIPSMDSKIYISFRTRLHFLLRRFKEDRNSIIHGNYDRFNEGWKSLVYLSAIVKISDLIKDYSKIYKD